jgi:hypothetical protein
VETEERRAADEEPDTNGGSFARGAAALGTHFMEQPAREGESCVHGRCQRARASASVREPVATSVPSAVTSPSIL